VVAIEFLVVPHEEAATEPYAGLIDLIAKYAKQIEHWEASFQIPELVDINVLVNEMVWYSTYPGSFTTPPCSEIVTFFAYEQGFTGLRRHSEFSYRHHGRI